MVWPTELTPSQLSRLANILDNAGQVVLATMVLNPVLLGGFDKINFLVVLSGTVGTVALWLTSLWLAKGAK